jgi:hypothetical protein
MRLGKGETILGIPVAGSRAAMSGRGQWAPDESSRTTGTQRLPAVGCSPAMFSGRFRHSLGERQATTLNPRVSASAAVTMSAAVESVKVGLRKFIACLPPSVGRRRHHSIGSSRGSNVDLAGHYSFQDWGPMRSIPATTVRRQSAVGDAPLFTLYPDGDPSPRRIATEPHRSTRHRLIAYHRHERADHLLPSGSRSLTTAGIQERNAREKAVPPTGPGSHRGGHRRAVCDEHTELPFSHHQRQQCWCARRLLRRCTAASVLRRLGCWTEGCSRMEPVSASMPPQPVATSSLKLERPVSRDAFAINRRSHSRISPSRLA